MTFDLYCIFFYHYICLKWPLNYASKIRYQCLNVSAAFSSIFFSIYNTEMKPNITSNKPENI